MAGVRQAPVQGIGNCLNACRKNQLRPAVCVAVPKGMYARYTTERAIQEARRAAFDAKMARREAFMSSIEELGRQQFKPAYRPRWANPAATAQGRRRRRAFIIEGRAAVSKVFQHKEYMRVQTLRLG